VRPKDRANAPVRPAGPLHAHALALIHAASFPPGETWGPDAIAFQLAIQQAFGLLHPDGGMLLARVTADDAEILTMAVLPEKRRRGIGRTLLAAGMREAASRGASALFLEVSISNQAARDLYRAAGFAEVGRRPRYYSDGADALVMRASLARPAAI
jgi:ribosomal-protein-alanine N-acetyltransferase